MALARPTFGLFCQIMRRTGIRCDVADSLGFYGLELASTGQSDVNADFRQYLGVTPGDMYHAFVSQKSHLMDYWEYTLSPSSPMPQKKGAWDWQYGDYNQPSTRGFDHPCRNERHCKEHRGRRRQR